MTIAMYEPQPNQDPTGGRLVAWASSLAAAHKIGAALCNTSFVPATFKGKPEEAAAAILFGDEIGLTPTQALQSVYVISGKPALYARAMVAIVLAAGHEVETAEKTDSTVSVRGRRRGSENWTVETWTKDRAKRAGYTNNKRYELDPQSMLYARAASDLCRQIAPDALAGIGYSVEELEIETARVTVTRADPPKAIKRINAAPSPIEPAFDEPAVTVDVETGEIHEAVLVEPAIVDPIPEETVGIVEADIVEETAVTVRLISDPQMRKMRALLNNIGMKDRAAILEYVGGVVGHAIESSKQLTHEEANLVINALAALESLMMTPEPPMDEES